MQLLLCILISLVLVTPAIAGDNTPLPDNSGSSSPNTDIVSVSGRLWVDKVTGRFVGDTGTFTFQIDLSIEHLDPPYGTKWSGFSNAFLVSSPNGVTWSNLKGVVSQTLLEGWGGAITVATWSNGISPDSLAFKTTGQPKKFLTSGEYDSAFMVSVLLNRSSIGKTICLDSLSIPPVYTWKWDANSSNVLYPQWGGKYCFTIDSSLTIHATAGPNGTITPSGYVDVTSGSNQSFTIAANTGYHIDDVQVDGSSVGAVSQYTFTNVTTNRTINADFAIDSFNIDASAGLHGSISPSGSVAVEYNGQKTFTITADPGYHISDVQVDGSSVGAVAQYTVSNVTSNRTIHADFAIDVFTIDASAGLHGSISPSGAVSVDYDSGATFNISPDQGYHIADVQVDGSSVGATSQYTFSNVTSNRTIHADFAIDTFTITATAGLHGSITPSGSVSVEYGSDKAFAIAAADGYHITDVKVDGFSIGAVASHTFTGITANHTIEASFGINSYSIEASAGPNGTISPTGTVWVSHGDNQLFTISPNTGYHVSDVFVDGSSIGPVPTYTFTTVTGNHSIVATFVIDTLVIQASSSANGTISPSGNLSVLYGDNLSFTMTPTGQGYLVDLFVDGASVGPQASYTFSSVSANHTIFALFNDSTFLPSQQYAADIMFLQTTDLDQDNFTDIVYSSSGSAPPAVAGLWIAYGLPGGSFEAPIRLLNARRTPITLGFVNADTLIDIVSVGGVDGQQVYTLINHHGRTFTIDSAAYSGPIANSIVSGYFNADAYVDFLLGNGILILGGPGAIASQVQITLDAISLNVADFNADGIADLAAGQGDSIKILLSDGIGGFTQSAAFFSGHNLSAIPPVRAVGDLDKDGRPDVASVVLVQETPDLKSLVTVGFSNGQGGFKSVFSQVIEGYAVNAQIADVDRDYNLDVVSSCGSNPEQRVIVLYGDGAGNFPRMSETSYPSSSGSTLAITTGDMDRDGNPDFVTGAYQGPGPITIMYSTPPDANVLVDEMVVTVLNGAGQQGANQRGARSGNSETSLQVINPDEYEIAPYTSTVSGSFYWQLDADGNLVLDDRTVDYNLEPGEYTIIVHLDSGATNPNYAVVVGIDGSQQATVALNGGDEFNAASSAQTADSIVYYFRVENPPAINPESGIPTSNAQPKVSWPLLLPPLPPGATFDFQLSAFTDFRSLLDSATGLATPEHLVGLILPRNNVYFWRVREVIAGVAGEWSHHYSLYISSGCCAGITGNVDCDPDNRVDISDLALLIDHLFINMQPLCCQSEANVDGSADGYVDTSDLSILIQNLYLDPVYHPLENCPQ